MDIQTSSKNLVAELFSTEGPFSHVISGFREREPQKEMAVAVNEAMSKQEVLLVEAGTGTGKTFAYLVPAFLQSEKVIVSTGTLNLQDQLVFKDLPVVAKALKRFPKIALLKGRQNYLCLYRMELTLSTGQFTHKGTAERLVQVHHWQKTTKDGDLSKVDFLSMDDEVIPFITSNADNCLGSDCTFFDDCYIAKARRSAMSADILVVNHHLLMADLALKEDGFGELLPRAGHYIIDEAHQLPDVATTFFGHQLSSRQIRRLVQDIELVYQSDAKDCRDLMVLAQNVAGSAAEFREALVEISGRQFWHKSYSKEIVSEAFSSLSDNIHSLETCLEPLIVKSRELEQLYERCQQLNKVSSLFTTHDKQHVQWLECFKKGFSLHTTPLNIAEPFQEAIAPLKTSSWTLTSATLAVDNRFEHFQQQLGWHQSQRLILNSPFHYKEQALLYLPRNLPNPNADNYTQNLVEKVLSLLYASEGRAFLLFTSYKALNEAADLLAPHTSFEYFVQGSASKTVLLDAFRQSKQGVLLGTMSFWEGVDVAGDALSLVIIDKLPFASPFDPVHQARIEAIKKEKQDPFTHYQLPQAVITLKQGAGRLIRSFDDKGVLVIADPRLSARQYGAQFLKNLPCFLRTRYHDLVEEFLQDL